ncbi:hypothetical protein FRC10_010249 [Ceratobasidium sp. 414]|nr:hypothetical protein FRC10_010249 [Ceratobasidium sp. 414]
MALPDLLTNTTRSFYTPIAGYLVDPEVLQGRPRKILLGDLEVPPNLVEANVRGNLMMDLGCEMPGIKHEDKWRFLIVPPSADNITGVESDEDRAWKAKAKEFGLDDLRWIHIQRPNIEFPKFYSLSVIPLAAMTCLGA